MDADLACLQCTSCHELLDTQRITGLQEIAVVARGQDGNRKELEVRASCTGKRSLEALRVAVNCEKARTEPRDLPGRTLHRVGDVVQLKIHEDALAFTHQALRQRQAAGISQLHTD